MEALEGRGGCGDQGGLWKMEEEVKKRVSRDSAVLNASTTETALLASVWLPSSKHPLR